MRYFIILLLSIALLIGLEYREHKQQLTKDNKLSNIIIESTKQAETYRVKQQDQVQTNTRKQTVQGFDSELIEGIKSFKLPGGDSVSFREGTFGDKFTSFLSIDSSKVGERFIFDDLTFYTGSANFSAESLKEIDKFAKVLKAFPKVHIKIEGHTDALGDATQNMALSFARANAVRNQLVVIKRINSNRLFAVGLGSAHPANRNNPNAKENRRIEIVIVRR